MQLSIPWIAESYLYNTLALTDSCMLISYKVCEDIAIANFHFTCSHTTKTNILPSTFLHRNWITSIRYTPIYTTFCCAYEKPVGIVMWFVKAGSETQTCIMRPSISMHVRVVVWENLLSLHMLIMVDYRYSACIVNQYLDSCVYIASSGLEISKHYIGQTTEMVMIWKELVFILFFKIQTVCHACSLVMIQFRLCRFLRITVNFFPVV